MMQSGVPILQALDIVGRHHRQHGARATPSRDVQDSVRSGESLTGRSSSTTVFPPMVVQMMAVGEDTGALDTMLAKIAEFYDQEVEATTEALTALIEPLMIAFLGGIVGGDDHRALHADLQRDVGHSLGHGTSLEWVTASGWSPIRRKPAKSIGKWPVRTLKPGPPTPITNS